MSEPGIDISTVGEFGLIERIRRIVGEPPPGSEPARGLITGISDDCAVYRPTPGTVQLITTDTFAEGIHFDLTFTPMKHLGWKVLAASLSDVAAMGGSARYAVVALSLPRKISLSMVEELYAGIVACGREFSCHVVGGDTVSTAGNMSVTVTVTGEAGESLLVTRGGAVAGDYLCVTGHLGASLAGLRILQREKARYLSAGGNGGGFTPDLEPYTQALERHFMPRPRFDFVGAAAGKVGIHAMIDVSDGISSDIRHICERSGTGAVIHDRNLPIEGVTERVASEMGDDAVEYALRGGEDYELLFTLSDAEYAKLEAITRDVSIIGRIVGREQGITRVREDGTTAPLGEGGWDHFRREESNDR